MTDRVADIRGRFIARLRGDLPAIVAAARSYSNETESTEEVEVLRFHSHRIAGLAGSLGLSTLGEIAAALDADLPAPKKTSSGSRVSLEKRIQDFIDACHNAISSDSA